MRLWAIGDIHISFKANRDEWQKLRNKGADDGLILVGDVGESLSHVREAFIKAVECFKHVFWVPGNHELYTSMTSTATEEEANLSGEDKYNACIDIARSFGILTPEDDYMTWKYEAADGTEQQALICPIFTLYDYSFRPADVSREGALAWALEENIQATDEKLLMPNPFSTRDEWCVHLVEKHGKKLEAAAATGIPLVIINHWPLREDLVYIPMVPRFTLWCGTKLTTDWHKKFKAKVVVSGHLHVRRTDWMDGTRFEEVSLGYPRQWADAKAVGVNVNNLLREVLPGPPSPVAGQEPPSRFRRYD